MEMGLEASIRDIAEVSGISTTENRGRDWEYIEGSLGVGLPSDYKLIADCFPDGWFRMFIRVWSMEDRYEGIDDRVDAFIENLQDLHADCSDEDSKFPFMPFWGAGGVLPFGSLLTPGWICWVVDDGNPDGWQLVLVDGAFSYWEEFNGSLCEFLMEVVSGRFDASRFKDLTRWGGQDYIDLPSRPVFTEIKL